MSDLERHIKENWSQMNRKYKVYKKDEYGKVKSVLETPDYEEAGRKEKELQDKGFESFVWQV